MRFDGVLFGAELLFIPLFLAAYVVFSADTVRRLIAMQLFGGIAALQLVLFAIAFASESFADVGISLALLAIGGGLTYAHFLERWL